MDAYVLTLVLQDFNPEKYQHLADIFGRTYLETGSPVSIVTHYLSVFTKGHVTKPPESCDPFSVKAYDIRKAYVACSFKGKHTGSFFFGL